MSNPIGATYIHPARKLAALGVMLLLALTASLGLGVQSAYASAFYTDVKVGDFTYDLYDDGSGDSHYGSVWVKAYSGSATEIVLPASVAYKGVTYKTPDFEFTVSKAVFSGNTRVTKIAIPAGYDVMRGAFAGCTGLTEVAIADNAPFIGAWDGGDGTSAIGSFAGCPNLKTYRINGTGLQDSDSSGTVDADDLKYSGIGQDNDGKVYPGVTVYTKKGSVVDQYIQKVNEESKSSGNGNQITLVYQDDPYSNHTVKPSGSGGSQAVTVTKGEDGTAFGKGASEKVAKTAILKLKNDKDPKGTSFGLLQAKGTAVGKNKVKLTWKKAGAKKFVIYGNKCGAKNKYKYLKTTTKTSLTLKKVAGAKVKKGTYYKFIVVGIDAKGKVVSTSKTIHVATTGGKVGNDKKVSILKGKKVIKKLSLKKGKTATIKAKLTPQSKKLKVKRHRKAAFESSNTSVATVNAKGKITAKGKGTCYIYAYAQNGVFAKVKVTVK